MSILTKITFANADWIWYNQNVRKKKVIDHLKTRWQRIKEREILELQQTSFNVRFIQTSVLMQFANSLNWRKKQKEQEDICRSWKKLRGCG